MRKKQPQQQGFDARISLGRSYCLKKENISRMPTADYLITLAGALQSAKKYPSANLRKYLFFHNDKKTFFIEINNEKRGLSYFLDNPLLIFSARNEFIIRLSGLLRPEASQELLRPMRLLRPLLRLLLPQRQQQLPLWL